MWVKMGTIVPEMGTIVHLTAVPGEYREAM